MKNRYALCALLLLTAVGRGLAADGPVPAERAAADVSMITAWIAGSNESKEFEKPFGDSDFITKASDAIFYSDVESVVVPRKLRRVPYEFIEPRMELIRRGHKVDPAVLITRSVAENPEEGVLRQAVKEELRKALPGERYYYIEVAIGNMAWHWMKVRIYESNGKLKVEIVRSAVS